MNKTDLDFLKTLEVKMESHTNRGNPWTNEEEDILLQELAAGNKIEEIAAKHSRTNGAIKARQNHIARRMVIDQGVSIEEAARLVRTSVYSVKQTIDASRKSLLNTEERHNSGVKKDETLLSVMIEIRDLMRQMVTNQVKLMNSL